MSQHWSEMTEDEQSNWIDRVTEFIEAEKPDGVEVLAAFISEDSIVFESTLTPKDGEFGPMLRQLADYADGNDGAV
jgi:hypothetical protein